MFEELENMVQSLGNSYIMNRNNKEETKIVDYNDTESQSSNYYTHDLQDLASKWEYLETLNQNLVVQNQKLEMKLEGQVRQCKQYEIELRSKSSKALFI